MSNKIIMLAEFALCIILIGLGFTFHFQFLLQNIFLIFMGIIALILASHRLDQVLGNGPYNTQKQKDRHHRHGEPQMEQPQEENQDEGPIDGEEG